MLHCIDERRASTYARAVGLEQVFAPQVNTNARAVGLEQVFAPQVDAGDEHPAYDAHDHAVGHHPACDAKAHTAGVCHPGCGQAGVVVGDPACQAKGAETLFPGVETLLPVQTCGPKPSKGSRNPAPGSRNPTPCSNWCCGR